MAEVSTFGAIYLIVLLMIVIVLYGKGKKKYTSLCEVLDKEEYPFKSFTVIGFAFMELIRYPYKSNLDRKIRKSLRELREAERKQPIIKYVAAVAQVTLK